MQRITDRRVERDRLSIATRQPIPFGRDYWSQLKPIGTRVTAIDRYTAYPLNLLGFPIAIASTVASSIAFPNGLTDSFPVYPGQYKAIAGAIEALSCVAVAVPIGLNGLAIDISNVVGNAHVNIANGNTAPWISTRLDSAYITTGLTGLKLVNAATLGAVLLPGLVPSYAIAVANPTLPDVLLRLWMALHLNGGSAASTDGLDLESLKTASDWCASEGLYYNGDVFPDFLEAWLYQASAAHGLIPDRTRIGLGFTLMQPPSNPTLLLSGRNTADLRRHWESRIPASGEILHVLPDASPIGSPWIGPRKIAEEWLGVRSIDTAHITKVQSLQASSRRRTEIVTGTFVGSKRRGLSLTLGATIQAVANPSRSNSGFVRDLQPGKIIPSWSGSTISGYSDLLSSTSLKDASKNFTEAASIGDILELVLSDGSKVYETITNVTPTTLGATINTSQKAASYRVFRMSVAPGDRLSFSIGNTIVNITPVPVFDPTLQWVIYSTTNLPPVNSALTLGIPKLYKITSVKGADFQAIG